MKYQLLSLDSMIHWVLFFLRLAAASPIITAPFWCSQLDEFKLCKIPIRERDFFRADIRFAEEQIARYAKFREDEISGFNEEPFIGNIQLWHHNVIPVSISSRFNDTERIIIEKGLTRIESVSCFRFPTRTIEEDYISIVKSTGCWSYLGRIGKAQLLSLDSECLSYPMVLHQILHVVGMNHPNSHFDRNEFITILWDNIDPGAIDNFEVSPMGIPPILGHRNIPYDYESILHFRPKDFANKGGVVTMQSNYGVFEIGQRIDLSRDDIDTLNSYFCSTRNDDDSEESNETTDYPTQKPSTEETIQPTNEGSTEESDSPTNTPEFTKEPSTSPSETTEGSNSTTENPSTEESTTEELSSDRPSTEGPSTEEPSVSSTEETITNAPTEEPSTNVPSTEEPPTSHTEAPPTNVPTTTNNPSTEEPSTNVTETTPVVSSTPAYNCLEPICDGSNFNDFYPHLNKHKYYRCVYYYPYVLNCPGEQVFSMELLTCSFSGEASCAS